MFFSTGKNCTLISGQQLENGRYTVAFVAFNLDQPSLRSQDVQVEVFVGLDYCFVDITPSEYLITLKADEVNVGDPVVEINATSTCGGVGDIIYNITSQMVKPGKL